MFSSKSKSIGATSKHALLCILVVTSSCMVTPIAAEKQQQAPLFGFLQIKQFDNYAIEYIAAAISLFLIATMVRGRKKNEELAIAYTADLLRTGNIIDRNFAEVTREVIKDGPNLYKLYVSGRRYCQGMLITFRLARRQDLLALIVASGTQDIVDIEVAMNQSAMPSTVFFIGSFAANKIIPEENEDISAFTRKVEPAKDRLPHWPAQSLIVRTEHSSIFYDIMSSPAAEKLFDQQNFRDIKKYFRFIHVTDDYRFSDQKHLVRVSFSMPSIFVGDDVRSGLIERFVALTMSIVDGLGNTKLTPEQLKKAQDARRKVHAKRQHVAEETAKRMEERRLAKEAEEKARLAKLPPDLREKEIAKRQKLLRERRLRSMAKK